MRFKYSFIIINLFFYSCQSNWGDFNGYNLEYDSSLDYYLILNKGEPILASDTKTEITKKGVKVQFHKPNEIIDTLIIGKGYKIINSFIDKNKINADLNFILVAQKPLEEICECNDCVYEKFPNKAISSYELCLKALRKFNKYKYWIVNKNTNDIYGPYDKKQYLAKRKELNVPKSLQLKNNF